MLRRARVIRYVTALREGGSLPGLVEADDDGMYVVKFHGAGQGSAALVAEVVVGEIGRLLGVRVPELVVLWLDDEIGRREPDPEIADLLRASPGDNLGLDFLPGSIGYDAIAWQPPAQDAAAVYWLDAFTANIDRTWRNPNLLVWHRELWAIDHGAALVFQHAWPSVDAWAARVYDLTAHVLGPVVAGLTSEDWTHLDAEFASRLDHGVLRAVLALVPDHWLVAMNAARGDDRTPQQWRERYLTYLLARLGGDRPWSDRPGAQKPDPA